MSTFNDLFPFAKEEQESALVAQPREQSQHFDVYRVLRAFEALGCIQGKILAFVNLGAFMGAEISSQDTLSQAITNVLDGGEEKIILFKVNAESRGFALNQGENNHYVALHFARFDDPSGIKITYIDPTGLDISEQIAAIIHSYPRLNNCPITSSQRSLQYSNPANQYGFYQMGGNDSDCGPLFALATTLMINDEGIGDDVSLTLEASNSLGQSLRRITDSDTISPNSQQEILDDLRVMQIQEENNSVVEHYMEDIPAPTEMISIDNESEVREVDNLDNLDYLDVTDDGTSFSMTPEAWGIF